MHIQPLFDIQERLAFLSFHCVIVVGWIDELIILTGQAFHLLYTSDKIPVQVYRL